MEQFLINEIHTVFVTDAKLSSHPIVQTVKNPDEITAIFDEITYQKVTIVISRKNYIDVYIDSLLRFVRTFSVSGIICDSHDGEFHRT